MSSYPQCLVFRMIKREAKDITTKPWELQKAWFFELADVIKKLTPTEFNQIFPITKEYRGHRWGFKDYFTVNEWISENIGWNNRIPDGFQFLMEYLNPDVEVATIQMMHFTNTFHKRQTGEDMFIAWAKANGIRIKHIGDD